MTTPQNPFKLNSNIFAVIIDEALLWRVGYIGYELLLVNVFNCSDFSHKKHQIMVLC